MENNCTLCLRFNKNSLAGSSRRVGIRNRIIQTICVHIVSEKSLTCGSQAVGVDKATDCGVVISCLEIVQSRFVVVVVTAIAERVCRADAIPAVRLVEHLRDIAPRVISIFDKQTEVMRRRTVFRAPDFNYIVLKILLVIIIVTEVIHADGASRRVIEEIRGIALLCTGKHRL